MFARSRFVINLAHWSHSAVNPSTKIAATATARSASWSGPRRPSPLASRLSSRLVRRTRFGAFTPGMRDCVGRGESPSRNRPVRITRGQRRGAEIPHKGRWLFVLGESRDATRRDARFSVTDLPRVEPRAWHAIERFLPARPRQSTLLVPSIALSR